MKLIIYNGSPRAKKSNTRLLMDEFTEGIGSDGSYDVETYYLGSASQRKKGIEVFREADKVILAFPLYTDAMPGLVKEFIEGLVVYENSPGNPDIGYVIQSGFPEPAHSRHVERYLERLTKRVHANYLGTVVKGGVEGIQIMPGWMTKKTRKRFFQLGARFNTSGKFDPSIIKKLAPKEQLGSLSLLIFKLLNRTKLGNFYWDNQLRENSVFQFRFDKPYTSNYYMGTKSVLQEAN